MELYGLIVFHSKFILNLPRLRKGKGVWVFLTRFQNVAEVIRASQHALIQNYERSMTILRDAVVS